MTMTSNTDRRAMVIVDAFASARCLAPLFRARGVDCVHVQSTPTIPDVYAPSFHPDDFIANIVHDGDVAATVAAIDAHAPIGLLPGIERAVMLADELSEELGLPTNGTAQSLTRRDKFRMIETARAAGIPGTEQLLATDAETLLDWYGRNPGRVVLKPVSSAGNDGIFFCDDTDQVRAAFGKLHGTHSVLGQENQAVLAQEYLVGSEYIVNTVSLHGRHHVTDIWKMHHLSANGVRDLPAGAELMPRHGTDQEALVEHTLLVLDALGIRNGPAHTELKLTPKGPGWSRPAPGSAAPTSTSRPGTRSARASWTGPSTPTPTPSASPSGGTATTSCSSTPGSSTWSRRSRATSSTIPNWRTSRGWRASTRPCSGSRPATGSTAPSTTGPSRCGCS